MNCPYCGKETRIADSRSKVDTVNRRRECRSCKKRFSTVEIDVEYYNYLQQFDTDEKRGKIAELAKEIISRTEKLENIFMRTKRAEE